MKNSKKCHKIFIFDIFPKLMNILYCAHTREKKFIEVIIKSMPRSCEYTLVNKVRQPFDFLDGQNTVIIIGAYKDVFSSRKNYFRFLKIVYERKIPIAAIIRKREIDWEKLPRGGQGIGKVIERRNDNLEFMVAELRSFLNIPQDLAYSTEG